MIESMDDKDGDAGGGGDECQDQEAVIGTAAFRDRDDPIQGARRV